MTNNRAGIAFDSNAGSRITIEAGSTPGDAILTLQIVLPPADTPKARELYETMAREMADFDPRHSPRA